MSLMQSYAAVRKHLNISGEDMKKLKMHFTPLDTETIVTPSDIRANVDAEAIIALDDTNLTFAIENIQNIRKSNNERKAKQKQMREGWKLNKSPVEDVNSAISHALGSRSKCFCKGKHGEKQVDPDPLASDSGLGIAPPRAL